MTFSDAEHTEPVRTDAALAFVEAERKAFAHYGLDVRERYLELPDPALRACASSRPARGHRCFCCREAAVRRRTGYRSWRSYRVSGSPPPTAPGAAAPIASTTGAWISGRTLKPLPSTSLDALELQSVPIVANSMGALQALWFALKEPTRVTALALLGCPAVIRRQALPCRCGCCPSRASTSG